MNISKRLKISYIILVITPIIIILFTSLLLQDNYWETIYKIKMSVQTEEFNKELYKTLGNDPNSLLEEEKLKELIDLTQFPETISSVVIINDIPVSSYGESINLKHEGIANQKFINFWVFNLDDGTTASIFFINKNYINAHIPIPFILLIFFYIILISLLTFLTSRKITRPLTRLKNAAISIKEEEFDIDISYNETDEIKDVFIAFDDMRLRLKQNAQKQLLYEKNRTELIANISHDLKTPITAIKGYIEGIVDGVANTPEKISSYHQTIYKKVKILDKLIDNLFYNSKLELKTVHFNFQKLNVNQFLTDIVEEFKFDFKDIDISYVTSSTENVISADPIQLQRVMYNIISNAVKYNDKDKCIIVINQQTEGSFVRVSVKDNGIGISQHSVKDMFKQFYRSDPARSSTTEGSGLGLAISKQIINEHRGEIFANNNLVSGLTITFKLPLLKELK